MIVQDIVVVISGFFRFIGGRMKCIFLFIVLFVASGCTSAPFRTGSVAIEKFSIENYKTSNPVDIKKDVAEFVQKGLYQELHSHMLRDSKLTTAADCSVADYRLTGTITQIDSQIESHYRFVTITVNQNFEVEVEGSLFRCSTGEKVLDFSVDEERDKMDEVAEELAEEIIGKIRKDKLKVVAK